MGALQIAGARLLPKVADYISAWFRPYLTDPIHPPSGTNNLFTAGAGGRERSDREPALAHSIYTDAKLEGGRITALIVLGLGALAAGYIARTKYKR